MNKRLHGASFQVLSILLMAFQSFIAPFLLGLEVFGRQIILLSCVLLSQAIFEPTVQSLCNKSASEELRYLNLSNVALSGIFSVFIFLLSVVISGLDIASVMLLFPLLVLYLLNTFMLSVLFSEDRVGVVSLSSLCLLVSYLGGFAFAYIFFPEWELVLGLTVGVAMSVAFLSFYFARYGWKARFKFGNFDVAEVINGFSFRLPTIMLTTGHIVVLSSLGFTGAVIGQYKIFVSAIMAGRYFNLVPMPQLQFYIQKTSVIGSSKEAHALFTRYFGSFLIFALLISASLPLLFDFFFEERLFSHGSLLLSVAAVLIQPIAYSVSVSYNEKNNVITLISIAASVVLGASFVFLASILSDPFQATGPSLIATLCFLGFYLVRANKGTAV